MMRQLNLNEMEMVSGGLGETVSRSEIEQGADPMYYGIANYFSGGAELHDFLMNGPNEFNGFGGESGVTSGSFEWGTGEYTVSCCSVGGYGLTFDVDVFTARGGTGVEPGATARRYEDRTGRPYPNGTQ